MATSSAKGSRQFDGSGVKTTTYVPAAIVGSLGTFDELLGTELTWIPTNEPQADFVQELGLRRSDLTFLTPAELQTVGGKEAAPINQFLDKNGIDIRIDELAPDELAGAAILRLLARWMHAGEVDGLEATNGRMYDAFRMKAGTFAFEVPNWTSPIVAFLAQGGDRWFMSPVTKDLEGEELFALVSDLSGKKKAVASTPTVIAPMVKLDDLREVSWLEGLWTLDSDERVWRIVKCLTQTRLSINHLGGRAESAAVTVIKSLSATAPAKPIVIDTPFAFWIERPDAKRPLFSAIVGYDAWMDPGAINFDDPVLAG